MKDTSDGAGFRGLVMIVSLAGGVWLAWQHTSLPQIVSALAEKHLGLVIDVGTSPPQGTEQVADEPIDAEGHAGWMHEPGRLSPRSTPQAGAPRAAPLETADARYSSDHPTAQASYVVTDRFEDPSHSSPESDEYLELERRLRNLGVIYGFHEMTYQGTPRYRYFCRVARGGNASQTRRFESADATPLGAMRKVLTQIESWHGSILPHNPTE